MGKNKYGTGKNAATGTFDHAPCHCGRHYGIGIWPADKRAQVYAWYRDYYPSRYGDEQRQWLASWQRDHGHQEPNMHAKYLEKGVLNPKWSASFGMAA